jgi:Cys-tRNA(Pro)/Cys-tRNA(Cys) deacylase
MAAKKLNSMRLLEREGVPYELLTFPESVHSAEGVAQVVGLPAGQVYKTLVVERPAGGRPLLVMVPGDRELDLKLLASCLAEKKLQMAGHNDAERLTGLQVGGISALALLNRGFEICLDRRAMALDEVVVSAGQRGTNLKLAVRDLIRVTHARIVDAS